MTIPKFRAWNKNLKTMHGTDDIVFINFEEEEICVQTIYFEQGLPDERDLDFYIFDEIEFMQSTGLIDKNGEEIFEGDIVRFSIADGFEFVVDEIGLVAYQSGAFRVLNGLDEYLINDNEYLIDDIDEIEVIGNIYENPEP